jgi:hypothetical protein
MDLIQLLEIHIDGLIYMFSYNYCVIAFKTYLEIVFLVTSNKNAIIIQELLVISKDPPLNFWPN